MGVDVDPAEIESFMVSVIQENITDMARYGMEGGIVDNTEMILARYFKLRHAEERMIWTNYIHRVKGKPPRPVTILKGPQQARNNVGGIEVRWAVDNKECIIAQKDFEGWCSKESNKFSVAQALNGLSKDFNATFSQRVQIGSGTVHGAGQLREPCIVIPVDMNGPLWDLLTLYTSPDDKEAFERAERPKPVDTGFENIETENSEMNLAG